MWESLFLIRWWNYTNRNLYLKCNPHQHFHQEIHTFGSVATNCGLNNEHICRKVGNHCLQVFLKRFLLIVNPFRRTVFTFCLLGLFFSEEMISHCLHSYKDVLPPRALILPSHVFPSSCVPVLCFWPMLVSWVPKLGAGKLSVNWCKCVFFLQ